MAKVSSPWVGRSHGKMGEGVYYHGFNKQLARARVRDPKNPKTLAQAFQRLSMRTAGKLAKQLNIIVGHSWENEPSWSSRGKFMSAALKSIDRAVGQPLVFDGVKYAPFVDVNSNWASLPRDLQIANGSLRTIVGEWSQVSVGGGLNQVGFDLCNMSDAFDGSAGVFFQMMGLPVGSQLTFVVAYARQQRGLVGSNVDFPGSVVFDICRINLRDTSVDGVMFEAVTGSEHVYKIAEGNVLMDKSTGNWRDLRFLFDEGNPRAIVYVADMADVISMGIIGSCYQGGTWKRTTSYMADPTDELNGTDMTDAWNDMQGVVDQYLGIDRTPGSIEYLDETENTWLDDDGVLHY